ncbi:MAG: ABC transporter ATP-binding protein [Pseudomonadota bacterium]
MMQETLPLLSVRGLDVQIDETHAVRGIDLTVKRGQTLALVGESGSGKSMTALALMGLTPPAARVSAQELCFETGAHPATLRGERVAMVFQEPMTALNPVFTIGDQLRAVFRHHRGGTAAMARARALELLERVGVREPENRLRHYPHMMSGGQRQRVLIAMALMCSPDLLIADEPTTALDVTTQAKLLDLLVDLQRELGLGILFITHDLGVVAKIADDVAVMKEGQIVETGPARSVLSAPNHPYTQNLLDSLPRPMEPVTFAQSGSAVLQADSLGQVYDVQGGAGLFARKTFRALSNVSLHLEQSEILGVVGESGCGKSTLARILIGLDSATEGRVEVCGDDASALPQRQLARRIQPVFQDPFGSLNPAWSVGRILELPLKLHTNLDAVARSARIDVLIADVGLPERVRQASPRALSGGQRQRVAIARALAANPQVVVCDEPTSALDVSVQAQILKLLRALRDEKELSILFISHDLAVVENLCDRVLVMDAGQIIEEGPADQIFATPRHPKTRALKEAVLEVEWDTPVTGLVGHLR